MYRERPAAAETQNAVRCFDNLASTFVDGDMGFPDIQGPGIQHVREFHTDSAAAGADTGDHAHGLIREARRQVRCFRAAAAASAWRAAGVRRNQLLGRRPGRDPVISGVGGRLAILRQSRGR